MPEKTGRFGSCQLLWLLVSLDTISSVKSFSFEIFSFNVLKSMLLQSRLTKRTFLKVQSRDPSIRVSCSSYYKCKVLD